MSRCIKIDRRWVEIQLYVGRQMIDIIGQIDDQIDNRYIEMSGDSRAFVENGYICHRWQRQK